MVCDFCALLVVTAQEFFLGPKLVARASLVFVLGAKILALDCVACVLRQSPC